MSSQSQSSQTRFSQPRFPPTQLPATPFPQPHRSSYADRFAAASSPESPVSRAASGLYRFLVTRVALPAAGVAALGMVFLFAGTAAAEPCGDDIDGKRVACACGDVVVSSTTLRPTDPVVSGVCERDGLFVRAAESSSALVVDLAGLKLQGRGRGTGLLISDGGEGGARIVSESGRARIEGFENGLRAVRTGSVVEVRGLELVANRRSGMTVRVRGASLRDLHASGNGTTGIHVSGSDTTLEGVVSKTNGGNGVTLEGRGLKALNMVALGNSRFGVDSRGIEIDVSGLQAEGNALGPLQSAGKQVPEQASGNPVP